MAHHLSHSIAFLLLVVLTLCVQAQCYRCLQPSESSLEKTLLARLPQESNFLDGHEVFLVLGSFGVKTHKD